jgi:hypothetical protein
MKTNPTEEVNIPASPLPMGIGEGSESFLQNGDPSYLKDASSDEPAVTIATALPEQPAEVPVTVYEVVLVGETEIELAVSPVFHEYESAPEAVNVAVPPEQIVGELTATSKADSTVTVAIAEFDVPLSVAVTV